MSGRLVDGGQTQPHRLGQPTDHHGAHWLPEGREGQECRSDHERGERRAKLDRARAPEQRVECVKHVHQAGHQQRPTIHRQRDSREQQ